MIFMNLFLFSQWKLCAYPLRYFHPYLSIDVTRKSKEVRSSEHRLRLRNRRSLIFLRQTEKDEKDYEKGRLRAIERIVRFGSVWLGAPIPSYTRAVTSCRCSFEHFKCSLGFVCKKFTTLKALQHLLPNYCQIFHWIFVKIAGADYFYLWFMQQCRVFHTISRIPGCSSLV